MLRTRLLSALVLLPIAFFAIFVGGWTYIALISIFAVIGGIEYSTIVQRANHRVNPWLVLLNLLAWIYWAICDKQVDLALLLIGAMFITAIYECVIHRNVPSFQAWAYTVGGGLYLGICFAHLILLRTQTFGLFWSLVSMPVIWAGDTAAYFIGRQFGRHKLSPVISPNKTWEGYAAQVVAGTLTGMVCAGMLPNWIEAPAFMNAALGAMIGFVLGVLCPVGDLFISLIKREFVVKNTSELIPGHGGVLDRVDALLWAGVLTQIFISLSI